MAIRPIDMQVLIPRSQKISNMQQNVLNKSEISMQYSYNENKVQSEKKMNSINTLERKNHTLIHDNNSNSSKYNPSKNKGQKNKETENKEIEENSLYPFCSNKIDIRI